MKSEVSLPLQQHPYFAAALRRLGRSVAFVDVAGAAPVLTVRQFGQRMASRGPVWHGDQHWDALKGANLRMINADAPQDAALRAAGFRRLMTNAYVAELDLTTSADDRIAAMKPKWRHALRKAQLAPLFLAEQRYNLNTHAWLLLADLAQQRIKRFRGLPHDLINAYATVALKDVRVLIAYEADTPIAGMLFLLHAPVATYHIGWTNARGRALSAHHRMITHAADHFADRGFERLDLGLVDTDTAPGLARFKIGTGARVRPLGGTWLRLPGCAR
ncbi:GNAT family N-acetyltransferase [Roseobacter sp. CCS2]|uniref:GNAT family N-acetyltransferase n=1 Tax=Roseobacter sp. CCS2 TaxID=391593 RepID=UPI0000F3C3D9|nr:GNAT family N-acetyltransferase [Roseobacter sp. CCS2]EBA11734.1 possible FemAB family protein [Roseobacter sp. CCS2]